MTVCLSDPQSVWSLGAPLGEGPVWVERDAALWFVDIKSHRVHRFDPASGDKRSWDAPAQVGFCLPTDSGQFIAGLQTGLALFDPATGDFTPIVDPEPDMPGNRLNDGVVDGHGRLWFGTMDDGEAADTGYWYRLDGNACIKAAGPVSITNGPALCPESRTIYTVDTLGGHVYASDVQPDGTLANTRLFTSIPNDEGYPDGPCVDAEGCVWISLYNGWGVRRYSPAGELLEVVKFPVSAITKIAFGGPDLKTVFATTAAKHLDAAGRAAQPLAGDLFSFRVGVPGLQGTTIKGF
ncbi:SMP-30/gluconolactonase/LRE family protein [Sphingomonas sp. BGYR3]|uniref:SMP-30/gluconolactonase/LRE family protein n=1 Tax=Sphingomonas sp. BGYR3 TaxID=2975483 RepID=UPI0021A4B6CE|nr:SMP-30/gluconolactonase/LRE family protein [Sphingomonas sp. BGYR3]MDG5487461.1 SMP-30/gluconolactonase/LRE family protein [Sphingomonas sp. BGYR3]